ncbi:hypothetical protein L798_05842 [Zootermopsis nevadensis]|uniref:Uncharacterized protein n=1 Tax=Zootermopsis nevadensis TaxID=136037 RepID=A0A067R6D3_ZOONE|nr:hypothetical protein L798_05842 [Zootermopsis nevadensis]
MGHHFPIHHQAHHGCPMGHHFPIHQAHHGCPMGHHFPIHLLQNSSQDLRGHLRPYLQNDSLALDMQFLSYSRPS